MASSERSPLLEVPREYNSPTSNTPLPSRPPSRTRQRDDTPTSHSSSNYWAYYIPAITWIPQYKLEYLFGDVCGGLTVASYQIPISMSLATSLASTPVISGLYGLIVPPLVYSLFGSVPQMVVGPEGAISLVIGQAMIPYLHHGDNPPRSGGSERNLDLTPMDVTGIITGTAGALLLTAGLFRLGFLDSVLSRALLRGFICAVGVVMMIEQLPIQLGIVNLMHDITGTHPTSFGKIQFILAHLKDTHLLTLEFSLLVAVALVVLRYYKQKYKLIFLPDILLVVILSTIICSWIRLDQRGLEIVGYIRPDKLIDLEFPFTVDKVNDFKTNFSASFFIAILGFFESIIAAKSIGSMFDYNISTNRELVAFGMVNLWSSLVGALPSFGGYARSTVNAMCGAKTQMSGIILSVITMFCMGFLLQLFYYLPSCVLASIISVIALTLIAEAPHDIKFYWKIKGYSDLFTLFVTFIGTVFWSVQTGIAVGVGSSLIRVIHHSTRPRIQILGRIPGTNVFHNADEVDDKTLESVHGCLIVKVPEPLIFANTGDLRNRLRRLENYGTMKTHPSNPPTRSYDIHHVIMDLHGMTKCDSSAVQILHELIENYIVNRNIIVLMVRMPTNQEIVSTFEVSGINKLLTLHTSNPYFDSVHEALEYIDSRA